mgnify:FL=1
MNNQLPENNMPQDNSEKIENVFELTTNSKVPNWVSLVVLGTAFSILGVVVLVAMQVFWFSDSNHKQTTTDYYQKLANKCDSDSCCARSVETMRSNGYKQMPIEGCSEGYQGNTLLCVSSYQWCELKISL